MQVDNSLKQQQLYMFEQSKCSNRAKKWQSDSGSSKQLKCSNSEQVQDCVQVRLQELQQKYGTTNIIGPDEKDAQVGQVNNSS